MSMLTPAWITGLPARRWFWADSAHSTNHARGKAKSFPEGIRETTFSLKA